MVDTIWGALRLGEISWDSVDGSYLISRKCAVVSID